MSKAAHDLITALRGKQNGLGDEQKHDLQRLSKIFKDVANTQKHNSPVVQPTAQSTKAITRRSHQN